MEKPKKKDLYEKLRIMVERADVANKTELLNFIDHEIELIVGKAERAKLRIQEWNEEEEVKTLVEMALTDNYQTIDDIMYQIDREDVSRQKVVAKLTQLVDEGLAIKARGKAFDEHRSFSVYKRV